MRDDFAGHALPLQVGGQARRRDRGRGDAQNALWSRSRAGESVQGIAPIQGPGAPHHTGIRRPRTIPWLDQRRDESNDRLNRPIRVSPATSSSTQPFMSSTRAALAVLIVALWIGGMTMMFRRNANVSEAQQFAEVALRLQPATFYYAIERDGHQIGAASSALDTTTNTLVSEEYFVGDYPAGKSVERTSARWQTRLTRGFHLV